MIIFKKYRLTSRHNLLINNVFFQSNVRAVNEYGYIMDNIYYSHNGEIVIFRAAILSYNHVLTINGRVYRISGDGKQYICDAIKLTENDHILTSNGSCINLNNDKLIARDVDYIVNRGMNNIIIMRGADICQAINNFYHFNIPIEGLQIMERSLLLLKRKYRFIIYHIIWIIKKINRGRLSKYLIFNILQNI